MRIATLCYPLLLAAVVPAAAAPDLPAATPSMTGTPAPPVPPPAPPYSLPWQLRPITVGNVLRSDTSVALYAGKDMAGHSDGGATVATLLLGSYKLTPAFAPLVRVALVQNTAPDLAGAAPSGMAIVNPMVGGQGAFKAGDLRLAGFLGGTIPFGMGGGDDPDKGAAEAAARGIAARSAMDNAMFAVNYFTALGGIGAGWLAHKATIQVEATILQLFRVRGPDTQDERRTNLTCGLHAGYMFLPWLSAGGELRYQRWLSTPKAVEADEALRDTVTFGVGPRLHVKAGGVWLRPGISYSRGLDAPLTRGKYQMIQVDVPVVF